MSTDILKLVQRTITCDVEAPELFYTEISAIK